MTSVYSSKNSNRYFLHQAILKSFSHRFSEIKLLKDFYPWANHTLLPNLYGDYRGKYMALGQIGGTVTSHSAPNHDPWEAGERAAVFSIWPQLCGYYKGLFPGTHLRRFSKWLFTHGDQVYGGGPQLGVSQRLTNKSDNWFTYSMNNDWSDPWNSAAHSWAQSQECGLTGKGSTWHGILAWCSVFPSFVTMSVQFLVWLSSSVPQTCTECPAKRRMLWHFLRANG
jgi:hypothetical protein